MARKYYLISLSCIAIVLGICQFGQNLFVQDDHSGWNSYPDEIRGGSNPSDMQRKDRSKSHHQERESSQTIRATSDESETKFVNKLDVFNKTPMTKVLDMKVDALQDGEIASVHKPNFIQKKVTAKHHLVFLKVHKAASTTLQTMFFKFGYERNLSFALPVKGHYFSMTTKFHEKLESPRYGDHYDIVCNHGFFNFSVYSDTVPKDSAYIAVVRNPLHQFFSAVSYYTSVYRLPYLKKVPENKIENLINFPEKYDSVLSYTMNSMARDFGFSESHYWNADQAKQYLEHLGDVFHFVAIAEHFDESLLMLKRLLNWSLKSILYISKNVRGSEVKISKELEVKFKYRNRLDYMLYNYFYKRFELSFDIFEDSITREMENFRRVLQQVQGWCSDKEGRLLQINKTHWNEEFVVTTTDCALMAEKELPFIQLLKGKKNAIR